jgi:dTDP-4-dehydrorhamnose 3,5-epimerase
MPKQINYYQPSKNKRVSEHFYKTKIGGLYYFQSEKHNDDRGYFAEIVNLPELEKVIKHPFAVKQVNQAHSKTNVVRGMHAEGWNKLVTVNSGLVFSAISDIRPLSDTYKQTEYFKLGFDHSRQYGTGLYICQGLANSVCALKGPVNYLYLVDKLYAERDEKDNLSISIFDSDLDITWPIDKDKMILSQRDKNAVSLEELPHK